MKKQIIQLTLICLISVVSMTVFAQSNAEMKALVSQMNKEMAEMVIAGRYEAMGKFYDPDAISLPNYRAMEVGYKQILNNSLGRKNGGYKILEAQKTTVELFVGQDMMVDVGTYSLVADFPGLKEPRPDSGKYINVWKKDKEGNWRIVAETWNADKSPNAPAQPKAQGQPAQTPSGSSIKPATGTSTGTSTSPVMDTKDGKK